MLGSTVSAVLARAMAATNNHPSAGRFYSESFAAAVAAADAAAASLRQRRRGKTRRSFIDT